MNKPRRRHVACRLYWLNRFQSRGRTAFWKGGCRSRKGDRLLGSLNDHVLSRSDFWAFGWRCRLGYLLGRRFGRFARSRLCNFLRRRCRFGNLLWRRRCFVSDRLRCLMRRCLCDFLRCRGCFVSYCFRRLVRRCFSYPFWCRCSFVSYCVGGLMRGCPHYPFRCRRSFVSDCLGGPMWGCPHYPLRCGCSFVNYRPRCLPWCSTRGWPWRSTRGWPWRSTRGGSRRGTRSGSRCSSRSLPWRGSRRLPGWLLFLLCGAGDRQACCKHD